MESRWRGREGLKGITVAGVLRKGSTLSRLFGLDQPDLQAQGTADGKECVKLH